MLNLISKVKTFFNSEDGATAIEYGLIAAGIAVAIIAAVFVVGDDLSSLFNTVASNVSSAESN
jgi:pilus assembly protein Flp/PilA